MALDTLKINQFRNLRPTHLEVSPGFNIFYGQNGSGKTSILEAIYYLGLGRSFRSHLAPHIIQYNTNEFSLFAMLNEQGLQTPIGIERSQNGEKKIRVDGEAAHSTASLAQKLPLQLLSTESFRYFCDGPKSRRQFLDWGVFHVEHFFFITWQQLQRTLKQRNAALKNKAALQEITAWDGELCIAAEKIDECRSRYVEELKPVLNSLLTTLLNIEPVELRYSRGWRYQEDLPNILQQNIHRDLQFGYTQAGPQKADLQLYHQKIPVHECLSQGQLKVASYALRLAQGLLMAQKTGKSPVYLIDDLPSELDAHKRSLVIQILSELNAQVFITGIDIGDFKELCAAMGTKMFHVEHGVVRPHPNPSASSQRTSE